MNPNMPGPDWPTKTCPTGARRSQFKIQNSKFKIRAAKFWTRDRELKIPAANFEARFPSFELRFILIMTICLIALPAYGLGFRKKAQPTKDYLADYIERVKAVKASTPSTGSFWTPQSPYSDMASDYKARNINDLIVIQVVESTTAAEDGAVKSARTFSASSGISALMGTPGRQQQSAKPLLAEFHADPEWAGANVL